MPGHAVFTIQSTTAEIAVWMPSQTGTITFSYSQIATGARTFSQ